MAVLKKKKKPGGWHYKRKPEAEEARRKAEAIRLSAADRYLAGESTIEQLAEEYGFVVNTVRGWVDARRKALTPRREAVRSSQRRGGGNIDTTFGTGGKMTDKAVRRATRKLGAAIVALQEKLGMSTFDYAGRDEG
jgi:transposase-like protein